MIPAILAGFAAGSVIGAVLVAVLLAFDAPGRRKMRRALRAWSL